MSPEQILNKVQNAAQILIEIGQQHENLLPSLLHPVTHKMLTKLPSAIAGQRDGDRAPLGCNLTHDEPLLQTFYALSEATGDATYREAADRYLHRFAAHCTNTATGLFPWGEHSFWHLVEDRVGDSHREAGGLARPPREAIHDHLRQTPIWLWQKLQEFNPSCVQRFAAGLSGHWTWDENGSNREYIRHAFIEHNSHLRQDSHSADFPRHSGFYILDWSFASLYHNSQNTCEQLKMMLDYWWQRREHDNLLRIESRSSAETLSWSTQTAPGQTLSLAASLLESAALLQTHAPAFATTMRERGLSYIEGFFKAPHDLENRSFVLHWQREGEETITRMPIWGSRYGVWPASYVALTALCAYRETEDKRLLDWAVAAGQGYVQEAFPRQIAVPAMDAGLALGLLADLFEITKDKQWLDSGLSLAELLMQHYFQFDLPCGAANIDWYESQMGTGFLMHGLSRLALMARDGRDCVLPANYTAR